ncbi:MAG: hypothetical protein CMJ94_11535 [Planctomycetes bacterium]|nr:hypothetical protein [Planctomycetota bacterium]
MLDTLRLLVDFGLVVLIWLVQLVIYPGFRYCSPAGLATWHPVYTGKVTLVVAPLMFGQLGLVAHQLWLDPRPSQYAVAALVALAWLSTFLQSVPAHAQISSGRDAQAAVERLIRGNWLRTFAWSAAFLVNAADTGLLAFLRG